MSDQIIEAAKTVIGELVDKAQAFVKEVDQARFRGDPGPMPSVTLDLGAAVAEARRFLDDPETFVAESRGDR